MIRGRSSLSLTALGAAACGANGEPPPGAPPAAETPAPAAADSMILSAPGGISVWLTEGRRAADSAGNACLERTLEVRHDTTRIKVPLLYTVSPPVLLDDTTLRAELANNCRAGDAYRVDLRTGRPTRIRGAGE